MQLKCTRELPQCARCVKFGVACDYPAPPDRKMLAAMRAPSERRRRAQHAVRQAASQQQLSPQQAQPNPPGLSPGPVEIGPPLDLGPVDSSHDIDLSAEVQDFLQEIYFSCQFHASLLFHQPTFLRAFEAGRVLPQVLLAVYASSTIFLPKSSPNYRQNEHLLRPLGDLKALGRRWALRAGRLLLQDVDRPTFTSVQVCEILALYWFSAGDFQRHTMFLTIGCRAASLLGLDTKRSQVPPSALGVALDSSQEWLSAEIGRRCFWAIFLTECINSDNQLSDAVFSDRVMDLPLPISESSYLRGRQDLPLRTLSSMQGQRTTAEDPETMPKPSVAGELMGAVQYWAKIRRLTESRGRKRSSLWLAEVFEMEASLSQWIARLPQPFQYSRRALSDHQSAPNQQALFIITHSLHRQCRLVLHASLVPQFSGLSLPEGIPPEVTAVSSRIVWSSAESISTLASDLLVLEWDPAKLPAFVGYCFYVAATVHIAVLGVGDAALSKRARTHLVSTLTLLKSLRPYWSVLDKLWSRINTIYAAQMQRLRLTGGATAACVASLHDGSRPSRLKDLDQLAGEVRDPGQLAEPLADSVLEYSLRRLRPDQNDADHTERTPDGAPYIGPLDRFLEEAANSSELNIDGQDESHSLPFEPMLLEPAQLFETSQDTFPMFDAWNHWGSTFGHPLQDSYNTFGFYSDL